MTVKAVRTAREGREKQKKKSIFNTGFFSRIRYQDSSTTRELEWF